MTVSCLKMLISSLSYLLLERDSFRLDFVFSNLCSKVLTWASRFAGFSFGAPLVVLVSDEATLGFLLSSFRSFLNTFSIVLQKFYSNMCLFISI